MEYTHLAIVDLGATLGVPWGETKSLADFAGLIISMSYIAAGLIMFFYLFFGGFSIISGAGNNDPASVARGKQAITTALVGFVIIFVSYWIIQLIDSIFNIPFI